MNLVRHNTPAPGFRPEAFEIASTKLTAPVRQKSGMLEFRICAADDSSLPAPHGAHLRDRPASPAELAQLERTRKAGGLVDEHSTIGEPARALIFCYTCRKPAAACTCQKPALDNGDDNTEREASEKPYDRARRKQRERLRARRRNLRGIEGGVP